MCVDMRPQKWHGHVRTLCTDMCVDMCTDVWVGTCTDICVTMCPDMCVSMHIDIGTGRCTKM